MSKTIEMKVTWMSLTRIMLGAWENPERTFETTKILEEEFFKMAKAADKYIELKAAIEEEGAKRDAH
jgi:hypothetical protein